LFLTQRREERKDLKKDEKCVGRKVLHRRHVGGGGGEVCRDRKSALLGKPAVAPGAKPCGSTAIVVLATRYFRLGFVSGDFSAE